MTFEEAITLGEYKPDFLAQFPEWGKLTHHMQFEYIAKALANRKRQLMQKWSEAVNFTNQSSIPDLQKQIASNIFDQIEKLGEEKEKLYLEYSKFTD